MILRRASVTGHRITVTTLTGHEPLIRQYLLARDLPETTPLASLLVCLIALANCVVFLILNKVCMYVSFSLFLILCNIIFIRKNMCTDSYPIVILLSTLYMKLMTYTHTLKVDIKYFFYHLPTYCISFFLKLNCRPLCIHRVV